MALTRFGVLSKIDVCIAFSHLWCMIFLEDTTTKSSIPLLILIEVATPLRAMFKWVRHFIAGRTTVVRQSVLLYDMCATILQ